MPCPDRVLEGEEFPYYEKMFGEEMEEREAQKLVRVDTAQDCVETK